LGNLAVFRAQEEGALGGSAKNRSEKAVFFISEQCQCAILFADLLSRGFQSAERVRGDEYDYTQLLFNEHHGLQVKPEKPMPYQSKVIAFDIDEASLIGLREALPDCVIDEVNGATAASLTRDWNPGTVDLFVVEPRKEVAETLELCRFLVSCGVLAKDAPAVTDSQEETQKTLGLHRWRPNVGRRSHSPLLVLLPPDRKSIVSDMLKAGAHSCLMLPINAKDVASMLVHAQAGNQPGRHTLDLEGAQTEDCWQDDGGQG
jgi:hypothetical protein